MGALIEGDPRQQGRLYTMGEIAQASGIKPATLQRRRQHLGIPPAAKGYTYEQARQMITKPVRVVRKPDPDRVSRLRAALRNDGLV